MITEGHAIRIEITCPNSNFLFVGEDEPIAFAVIPRTVMTSLISTFLAQAE